MTTQQELPCHLLSSGEKHLITLFYELIFESKSHSLFLIDEPEFSLHIEWQRMFIDSLLTIRNSEINELKNLQFILATHSPSIVSHHHELLLELSTDV
jgi:predicted ATP-dependent endonuclease of OLD family